MSVQRSKLERQVEGDDQMDVAIRVAELRPVVESAIRRFKDLIRQRGGILSREEGAPELFNACDRIEGKADDEGVEVPMVYLRAFLLRLHLLGYPSSERLSTLAIGTDGWRAENSWLSPSWMQLGDIGVEV